MGWPAVTKGKYMTKVNFADTRKKADEAGLIGGGSYLKLQEGDNRIRLMSECLEHPGEFNGKPTFKWLCYVIDRTDGKVKPFFMPHTIYKHIEALQMNPEYTFEEVPMPYDITIHAKSAGKLEVEYTITAARTNTPLTPAEKALFQGTMPIRELQQALREEGGIAKGQGQPTPDDEGPSVNGRADG